MLPMPEYTHPDGCLNMVSYLQTDDIKPDLGPKTYVAFGRCAALRPCASLCCGCMIPVPVFGTAMA